MTPGWLRVDSEGVRWVTVKRAAEVLGITEAQARHLIRTDRLYSEKRDGRVWALEYALQYARTHREYSSLTNSSAEAGRLISLKQVEGILDLGRGGIRKLVDKGKLTRVRDSGHSILDYKRRRAAAPGQRVNPVTWWYRLEEVEELAESRVKRGPGDCFSSLHWWGDRSTFKQRLKELMPQVALENAPDGSEQEYRWISPREAGEILGVGSARVHKMVRTGLLPAHQERPGKSGSRLWIYSLHVYSLMKRPMYQERRARMLKGLEAMKTHGRGVSHLSRPPFESTKFPYGEMPPIDPRRDSARTLKDYGEYYTTRQVALLLGVSVMRVLELRRTGRLQGYKRPPIYEVIREQGSYPQRRLRTGNQWWSFKKADVDALLADHSYCVRRRGYERSLRR